MGEQQQDGKDRTEVEEPFISNLESGSERFLAEVVAEVLATGEQGPEDFIRHFSPAAIMEALSEESILRAQILIPTTGLKERMALRKSAEGAGADLQMALEEEVTTAEEILKHFKPDNRVRYLQAEALWAFATETAFWEKPEEPGSDPKMHERQLVAFILDRAIKNGLLTASQIVNPVMSGDIFGSFPPAPFMSAVRKALEVDVPFTPELFLEAVPLKELIEHISTKGMWETILTPEVAVKHGLAPEPEDLETVPPEKAEKPASAPPTTGDAKDESWEDLSTFANEIDESSPPEVTDADIQLGDGDVEDVMEGDESGAAGSIGDALAQVAEGSGDSPDAEVTIEADGEVVSAAELMDAVEDDDDAATRAMESPFTDGPQIEDGAFAAARAASDVEDRLSTPGSVSSSADLVKKSLVQRLRGAGFKLGSADTADIKHVIIQTLAEIDPKTYGGSQALGLMDGKTSGLVKVLVRNLRNSKGDKLADAVHEDLQTVGAASVVVPNPDPRARKTSKAPRPSRKKE